MTIADDFGRHKEARDELIFKSQKLSQEVFNEVEMRQCDQQTEQEDVGGESTNKNNEAGMNKLVYLQALATQ